MQHHDGITGTHKVKTGEDYLRMMTEARDELLDGQTGALSAQIEKMAEIKGFAIGEVSACKL